LIYEERGTGSGRNILAIKVDLLKEFGPSSSGKTIIIASTEDNVAVEGMKRLRSA